MTENPTDSNKGNPSSTLDRSTSKLTLRLERIKTARQPLDAGFLARLATETNARVFVETGTYLGGTTAIAADPAGSVFLIDTLRSQLVRHAPVAGDWEVTQLGLFVEFAVNLSDTPQGKLLAIIDDGGVLELILRQEPVAC